MVAALLIFLSAVFALPANAAVPAGKILLVVSSYGERAGQERPGFEMDELSQAYSVFTDNGFAVDIASPSGGEPVADEYDPAKPYNARVLKDPDFLGRFRQTLRLSELRAGHYRAIFVIGGKGAMFDLPTDTHLKLLIAEVYEAGGVVGAVCHGPMVFANLQLSDGRSLIAGRKLTGFSNDEERLFGKRWVPHFPVFLEDALQGAGAQFSKAAIMLSHVVADDRLITGQNPYSTARTAEAMVAALGQSVAARNLYPDERSMDAISETLGGASVAAAQSIAADPSQYDIPLIAVWGYYRTLQAGDDHAMLAQGIAVMELAEPHFADAAFRSAMEEARKRLENRS
jgi:putative intracellular protease/amidase